MSSPQRNFSSRRMLFKFVEVIFICLKGDPLLLLFLRPPFFCAKIAFSIDSWKKPKQKLNPTNPVLVNLQPSPPPPTTMSRPHCPLTCLTCSSARERPHSPLTGIGAMAPVINDQGHETDHFPFGLYPSILFCPFPEPSVPATPRPECCSSVRSRVCLTCAHPCPKSCGTPTTTLLKVRLERRWN